SHYHLCFLSMCYNCNYHCDIIMDLLFYKKLLQSSVSDSRRECVCFKERRDS
uniref:Uncharacterized protein n=1 Tax=Amphimedon queenslandica TaxID=400682 RepID=A0A1X7SVK1_AMPQE